MKAIIWADNTYTVYCHHYLCEYLLSKIMICMLPTNIFPRTLVIENVYHDFIRHDWKWNKEYHVKSAPSIRTKMLWYLPSAHQVHRDIIDIQHRPFFHDQTLYIGKWFISMLSISRNMDLFNNQSDTMSNAHGFESTKLGVTMTISLWNVIERLVKYHKDGKLFTNLALSRLQITRFMRY